MLSAEEALDRLKEGNRRFVRNRIARSGSPSASRLEDLVDAQTPFAAVLGCADSRVPPELVFDQTLGDLFVIRIAGNIATPAVAGSLEFAVEQLGTRLIVVLGHSGCGAIQATLADVDSPSGDISANLGSIIADIRPVVDDLPADDPLRLERAVRANVLNTKSVLTELSELIARRRRRDGLRIVGAEYDLETGMVNFLSDAAW